MAKIEFNIQYRPQIESGEYKVETRTGHPARIICWDAKGEFPIISLVDCGNHEFVAKNTEKGYLRLNNSPDCCDLFIVTPEPELTEFEKEICGVSNLNLDYSMKDEIRSAAAHILDLARKQIIKEAEGKAANEGYDIEDAVAFNEGFKTAKELYSRTEEKIAKRLPTIHEWKWLIKNCKWEWDKERKGQVITAPNGNSIFLPAAGYRYDNYLYNVGSNGRYWSSSPYTDYLGFAYGVYFYPSNVTCGDDARYYGFSVRPVSDTPQEGFVDMGNNLFWAEKNEEGYFTYDEAMKLFNS